MSPGNKLGNWGPKGRLSKISFWTHHLVIHLFCSMTTQSSREHCLCFCKFVRIGALEYLLEIGAFCSGSYTPGRPLLFSCTACSVVDDLEQTLPSDPPDFQGNTWRTALHRAQPWPSQNKSRRAPNTATWMREAQLLSPRFRAWELRILENFGDSGTLLVINVFCSLELHQTGVLILVPLTW